MKRALSKKNLWENAPPLVRSCVGRALGLVPQAWLLGRRFRDVLAFVEQSQWWPREQAEAYQLQQLRRIIELAYAQTPYYRRAFDQVGFEPGDLKSLDDLRSLPLIDKDTLREHLNEMCTVSPGTRVTNPCHTRVTNPCHTSGGVDYVSTGGTSGAPLHFYINANRSAPEYAHLVAGWQRVGYSLDMPQAVLRGQVVQPDRTGLRHAYDPLLRRHHYSSFHLTDENMRRYLQHIATIGPCVLHVYPSTVSTLARFIERSGEAVPGNIRAILAGSEIVYPEDRARAKRVFGVPYASWYGHSEKLVLAAECAESSDYHVWPTYGYFELLDEQGVPVTTPGQRGEIVGTGFINTVMPFIRYRTGDFATYVGEACPACNRQQTLIRDVRGHRTQEMLVASDGALIVWTALNMHDDTFEHVRQFQFYQDHPGQATLRIVPAAGFADCDLKRIRKSLDRKMDGRIDFDVRICETIKLTGSGKCTYVDQRIDLQGILEAGVSIT